MTLNDAASIATIAGSILGLLALTVALWTLARTNKIGSAGALLAFYQSATQGWERVIQQNRMGGDLTLSVGDLLNTLELGACLYEERVFTGSMRSVLGKYIRDCIEAVDEVASIRAVRIQLINDHPETFKFLVKLRFSAN